MKKFLSPEAELLELDLADVICTSQEAPLKDPNAATGEAPAPSGEEDGGEEF